MANSWSHNNHAVAHENLEQVESARVSVSAVPLASDVPEAVVVEPWQVLTLKQRIDASNHADLVADIHEALAEGSRKIALDLTQNRFFSLNAIQFCMSVAGDLYADGGQLALIGCAEKTRRHFDIYGSLKQIRVVRSIQQLVTNGNGEAVNIRFKEISPEAR